MYAESHAYHYSNFFLSYARQNNCQKRGKLSVTHSSYHLVNISVLMNVHNSCDSPSSMA